MPPEGWGKQYLKVALSLLAAAFAQNMLQPGEGKKDTAVRGGDVRKHLCERIGVV